MNQLEKILCARVKVYALFNTYRSRSVFGEPFYKNLIMENFKKLTKAEMRNVEGGMVKPITCCGHTADGALSQCGISMAAAKEWEMWCCSSCQGPYN